MNTDRFDGAAAGGRIPELDGWRGISILFVVTAHLTSLRYGSLSYSGYFRPAGVLAGCGVGIFFVISGFIITRLALQERNATGKFSACRFYFRRFFRIVPPFFLYLACVVAASAGGLIVQQPVEALTAASFTCNFPDAACRGWFVVHSWTLAYEQQFYLVFPLVLAAAGRHARRTILAIFIVLTVYPLLRFALHLEDGWHSASRLTPGFLLICAGAVLAAYEDRLARLMRDRTGDAISLAAAAVLIMLLLREGCLSAAPGTTAAYVGAALNQLFLPTCLASLVGYSLVKRSFLTSLLVSRPLQLLGMISYSLYLWQQLFTAEPTQYLGNSLLLISPAMLVVAALSYYYVERPSIRLGRRLQEAAAMTRIGWHRETKAMALLAARRRGETASGD